MFISLRVISLQEFPVEYLIGWLLITTCSFIGLTLLSFYGSHLEQPAFTALCLEPRNRQKANSKTTWVKTCKNMIKTKKVTSNLATSKKAIHCVWIVWAKNQVKKMVRFIFLPLWRPSKQKTRRQGSRPCRCRTCRRLWRGTGVVFGSPTVRCPKPWLLRWTNTTLRSTRAISLRPLSDTLWTWGVPCTFQSTPAIIWSTSFLKNMAKNVVSWSSSRLCNAATWSSWIFATVIISQQGRGKDSTVPIGRTWRRQISLSASQGEMVEGFLVFCGMHFSLLETVRKRGGWPGWV